jgi:phosphatidylglycerophosphatase C
MQGTRTIMISPVADNLPSTCKRKYGVAAFDFDGTLASQHTMYRFLVQTHGWPRFVRTMLMAGFRVRNRDELKVATVGALFKGMPLTRFVELGEQYATTLDEVLRPEMLERLQWHQEQGHATVIVSAALGVYLRPLGQRLGVHGVVGVELSATSDGVLDGRVDGGVNIRGPEKLARLRAWIAEQFGDEAEMELWAYGDSSGDRELLLAADHPTWIKF